MTRSYWFLYRVFKNDVLIGLNSVPVWRRDSENPDDYLGAHPDMLRRARAFLLDKWGADHTFKFISEVYPYGN